VDLSEDFRAVLDRAAELILERKKGHFFDLYDFDQDFGHGASRSLAAIREYLRGQVEELSKGSSSIRAAEPALFASRIRGNCLYLALCSSNTPNGTLRQLEDDTMLFIITPSDPGLEIDTARK